MRSTTFFALAAPVVLALPAPAPQPLPLPVPVPQGGTTTNPLTGLIAGLITGVTNLGSVANAPVAIIKDLGNALTSADAIGQAIANGTLLGTDVPVVVQKLFQAVQPTATPTSVQQALNQNAAAWGIQPGSNSAPTGSNNALDNVVQLLLNGFTNDAIKSVSAGQDPYSSQSNNNNRAVPLLKTFYNNPLTGNPSFTVPETKLRAAIRIPSSFTWGQKQPVIMSPGTGTVGTNNFLPNIGKLLSSTSYADPVYLNIPQNLLGDIQANAEYVAYAILYFNALTSKKSAVVTWSQGSLDTQWAFKYWPSTRNMVTDHIAISPDYHGTILAYILCPGFALVNGFVCTPAVIQQAYNSRFVNTLRANGGDSAYVPTTTVYTLFDEIVQPQIGTAASGFIQDARGVGASNTFLQGACAGLPASGLYGHAGVLFNPVAYALVVDALTHDGPGSFSRVSGSCKDIVAPGLSVGDVVQTLSLIPEAVLNILSYLPKVGSEPAIMGYASR